MRVEDHVVYICKINSHYQEVHKFTKGTNPLEQMWSRLLSKWKESFLMILINALDILLRLISVRVTVVT